MTFNITVHAVEQFIRRWAPDKMFYEAEDEIDALLRTSTTVGKTHAGDTIVVSGHRPEIRLVLKERNVCVTVLPPGSFDAALSEYEQELMEEMVYSKEQRMTDLQGEIQHLEQEVKNLDEQRRAMGQRKGETITQIQRLKTELKLLDKQR